MPPRRTIHHALLEYEAWKTEADPALLTWSALLLGCALVQHARADEPLHAKETTCPETSP